MLTKAVHSQHARYLRPAAQVMRLSRMGSFHQTRISFMRSLLRRIASEQWALRRVLFELDEAGYGTVVYRITTPTGICSLVAFSHELPPEERSDRVIAEKWDATFALLLGEPNGEDIERLRANVPRQEAGRCGPTECVLSRANKSMRIFEYVVECLASGEQPLLENIVQVGYLMRTTAVYGNGKFGLSDLSNTFASGLFQRPFEAEMLTVYLIREFTIDLAEHIALQRAPQRAVKLDTEHRRAFGIGNATGLGMAPFLVSHPILIHRWMLARETAIVRVLAEPKAAADKRQRFLRLLRQAQRHVCEWHTDDDRQSVQNVQLLKELAGLEMLLTQAQPEALSGPYPWRWLTERVAQGSEELQELVNSLMIELYGELVDDLVDTMRDVERPVFDPTQSLQQLRSLIEQHYDWALAVDFTRSESQHFFWYRSAEKEEPRLGERYHEPGADLEMRLGIARDVQALYQELTHADATESVAAFLLRCPQWRFVISRVQTIARYPYGEIRDNLLAADCVAVNMLRCKLSFFGAIKFDPKSDRWTRITLYQGAPGFEQLSELDTSQADDWFLPVFTRGSAQCKAQPEKH